MAKHDIPRRIDLRPTSGNTSTGYGLSTTSGLDDSEFVRRDGTRSLYSSADWVWETGARVAGVLRAWGNGLLQVIGALYAGQRAGAHSGFFNYRTDAGTPTAVVEVTDAENKPVFSAWAADGADPDEAEVNIGREGYPRITFKAVTGYDRKIPQVPPECIEGLPEGSAVTDHGALTGLLDDDHPQYLDAERGAALFAGVDHTHEGGGIGDVVGPASAVSGNFASFNGTTGKLIQDSGSKAADFATADHTHAQLHDAVTLGADADVLLGLTGQQLTLDVQNANKVLAGPTSGADADPAFRALVAADLPASTRKRQVYFTISGSLEAGSGKLEFENHLGVTLTIVGVYVRLTTAPTGAAAIFDLNIDGTTCFTTQSNRPQVAADATTGNSTTVENATWADGHYLGLDVDQIGSTVAGADLTACVVVTE